MTASERRNEFLQLQKMHEDQKFQKQITRDKFLKNEEKTDNEINKLITVSHLLVTLSIRFFADAEEKLLDQGLRLEGSISKSHKYYTKAADNYCREFSTMIKTKEEKSNFWKQLEEIEQKVRQWIDLDGKKEGPWNSCSECLPEPGKKVVVITKDDNVFMSSTIEADGRLKWSGKFSDRIIGWIPKPNIVAKEVGK